ncbi:hypothetical protein CH063_08273, partial [Colletotrichum higginsianum]
PTQAVYENVMVPASGAIVFDQNFSPTSKIARPKAVGTVPYLDKLSDVAYFQWQHSCRARGVEQSSLKVVFRSKIIHKGTSDIVIKALKDAAYTRIPGFAEKAVFSMDSREGQAILGTVHGSSTAWMLIQHKKQLGLKRISEVAVFSSGTGHEFSRHMLSLATTISLRFTIIDA